MTDMIPKRFDALDYVDKAVALGLSEDLAKFQARQFMLAIETAVSQIMAERKKRKFALQGHINALIKRRKGGKNQACALR